MAWVGVRRLSVATVLISGVLTTAACAQTVGVRPGVWACNGERIDIGSCTDKCWVLNQDRQGRDGLPLNTMVTPAALASQLRGCKYMAADIDLTTQGQAQRMSPPGTAALALFQPVQAPARQASAPTFVPGPAPVPAGGDLPGPYNGTLATSGYAGGTPPTLATSGYQGGGIPAQPPTMATSGYDGGTPKSLATSGYGP